MVASCVTVPLLRAEGVRYGALRERLLADIPNLDAETLADTLEGISDLNEMLAEVIRSALEDEALIEGLSTRLKDMKARLERLSVRAERKRQLALRVMSEAEIQKLTAPDLTASLKQGAPTLEVRDEAAIPAVYWKPQPSKLDRQGLLAALKIGVAVEGCDDYRRSVAVEREDEVMALTDTQTRSLKAKLKYRHVRIRELGGSPVAYVEGWHAISEANRIFGFDSWDRQTLSPRCHWSHVQQGETICFYSTKVRITVRAGDTTTVREGIGTGFGRAQLPELAHDVALKAAETDATKRALATFGNPFGLALYDRDLTHVTKARKKATAIAEEVAAQDLVLRDGEGRELRYAEAAEFVTEALRQIAALDTVESVYAFWSRNAATFGKLRVRPGDGAASARRLADALKGRAREIGVPQPSSEPEADTRVSAGEQNGSYLIPKEKRIRDKDHLAFVASQPCLVCGRKPAQAHHVRFAQPHGLGIKVSDEFTVPLCNTHHDQLHRSGNERRFWAQNAVPDPLKSAARLWEASRGHRRSVVANGGMKFDPDMEAEFSEPYLAPPKAPSQVAKPAVVSSAGSSDSNPCDASEEGLAQERPA